MYLKNHVKSEIRRLLQRGFQPNRPILVNYPRVSHFTLHNSYEKTIHPVVTFHLTGSVLLVRLPCNSTLKLQSFVSSIYFCIYYLYYATYDDRDVFLLHYCKQDTRLIHETSHFPPKIYSFSIMSMLDSLPDWNFRLSNLSKVQI